MSLPITYAASVDGRGNAYESADHFSILRNVLASDNYKAKNAKRHRRKKSVTPVSDRSDALQPCADEREPAYEHNVAIELHDRLSSPG